MLVLVTGATGFLGRRVVRELLSRHHQVRCLVHVPGRERIFSHREVEVHYGSVLDPASLASVFYDVEAVVHLVGVIRRRTRDTFDSVHRQGTANVLAAAKEAGVRQFQHVSVNGAANDRSYPYLYTKWQGEQEVINSGLPYSIFRPSMMFGEGDEFLNALAGLVRLGPVAPVIGPGKNRLQPMAVEDVARCIGIAIERQDLKGKIFPVGGPDRLSYNEIVEEVARAMGKRVFRLHLPVWPVYLAAWFFQQIMPRSPITTDQIRMLGIRNVTEIDEVERVFGFTPRPLRDNIDFVNYVGFLDGLQMALGMPPRRSLRDH